MAHVAGIVRTSAVVALALCSAAHAQWPTDAATLYPIGAGNNDQVQPKVVGLGGDGGAWISWFDNAAGGYDVALSRVDAAGLPLPGFPLIVRDRTVSSTTDYDLVSDAQGNAYLTFPDDTAVPGSVQIVVHKVLPDGTRAWGAAGVVVSEGTAFKGNPHAAVTADGSVVCAWSEGSSFVLRRVTAGGVPAAPGRLIAEPGHSLAVCDVVAGDNNSMIVLWTRSFTTSFQSSKWLYAQRYNADLAEIWAGDVAPPASAVAVYAPTGAPYGAQGGSVQNGYFPSMVSDGAGGAVIGWYENAGPRQAYVQHVLSDGTRRFPGLGLSTGLPAGRIAIGAGASYQLQTGSYILAWPESASPAQGNYSVRVQKWNASGQSQWADGEPGVTLLPQGTGNQPSFVQSLAQTSGGAYVFCFDSRNLAGTTHVLFGAGLNAGGEVRWSGEVCSTVDSKSRLSSARAGDGSAILAYGHGALGAVDVMGRRVLADGSIGFCNADVGGTGGSNTADGRLDSNDLIAFIDLFFSGDARADVGQTGGIAGPDGQFDNNDFVVYIDRFFSACS